MYSICENDLISMDDSFPCRDRSRPVPTLNYTSYIRLTLPPPSIAGGPYPKLYILDLTS